MQLWDLSNQNSAVAMGNPLVVKSFSPKSDDHHVSIIGSLNSDNSVTIEGIFAYSENSEIFLSSFTITVNNNKTVSFSCVNSKNYMAVGVTPKISIEMINNIPMV